MPRTTINLNLSNRQVEVTRVGCPRCDQCTHTERVVFSDPEGEQVLTGEIADAMWDVIQSATRSRIR
jgi:hypothetical protein